MAGTGNFWRRVLLLTFAIVTVGGFWATKSPTIAQGWFMGSALAQGANTAAGSSPNSVNSPVNSMAVASPTEVATEVNIGGSGIGIFSRAMQGGPVVFLVLLILVGLSVTTWAALVAKWWNLNNLAKTGEAFVKSFWDSRSLNDLNSRLSEYPFSPVREVFRTGYAELVRGSQLRDQASSNEMAVSAALDNLGRALIKAKATERRRMEKFQTLLAISASASPFIGLFGTVWGIMNAFEGIARTGSASLAAVAPGISEALIATAFGLAAAIPAVVGYNIFSARIRIQMTTIDGFSSDFLNIVERYLVTDRAGKGQSAGAGAGAHSPTL